MLLGERRWGLNLCGRALKPEEKEAEKHWSGTPGIQNIPLIRFRWTGRLKISEEKPYRRGVARPPPTCPRDSWVLLAGVSGAPAVVFASAAGTFAATVG